MTRAFLAVLYMALLVVLFAIPYALVLVFPEQGESLARITSTTFRWIIVFLLFVIFYDPIKSLLTNIREVSAAGITAKVGQSGTTLSADEIDLLRQHLEALTQGNEASQQLARQYFLRFVGATIYGSQYELLQFLSDNEPTGRAIAMGFYASFCERLPKNANVTFEDWMAYMTNNSLVIVNADANYEITIAGNLFVAKARQLGVSASSFSY